MESSPRRSNSTWNVAQHCDEVLVLGPRVLLGIFCDKTFVSSESQVHVIWNTTYGAHEKNYQVYDQLACA